MCGLRMLWWLRAILAKDRVVRAVDADGAAHGAALPGEDLLAGDVPASDRTFMAFLERDALAGGDKRKDFRPVDKWRELRQAAEDLERIGAGSYGTVYRAQADCDDVEVAFKQMGSYSDSVEGCQHAVQEAELQYAMGQAGFAPRVYGVDPPVVHDCLLPRQRHAAEFDFLFPVEALDLIKTRCTARTCPMLQVLEIYDTKGPGRKEVLSYANRLAPGVPEHQLRKGDIITHVDGEPIKPEKPDPTTGRHGLKTKRKMRSGKEHTVRVHRLDDRVSILMELATTDVDLPWHRACVAQRPGSRDDLIAEEVWRAQPGRTSAAKCQQAGGSWTRRSPRVDLAAPPTDPLLMRQAARQLVEAVAYLHAGSGHLSAGGDEGGGGWLHRDIKPENVFVQVFHDGKLVRLDEEAEDPHGGGPGWAQLCAPDSQPGKRVECRFLLGDFGVSIQASDAKRNTAGTRRFMPPEIQHAWLEGKNDQDAAGDFWALGLTLYMMWSGVAPFVDYSLPGNAGFSERLVYQKILMAAYQPPEGSSYTNSWMGDNYEGFRELPKVDAHLPRDGRGPHSDLLRLIRLLIEPQRKQRSDNWRQVVAMVRSWDLPAAPAPPASCLAGQGCDACAGGSQCMRHGEACLCKPGTARAADGGDDEALEVLSAMIREEGAEAYTARSTWASFPKRDAATGAESWGASFRCAIGEETAPLVCDEATGEWWQPVAQIPPQLGAVGYAAAAKLGARPCEPLTSGLLVTGAEWSTQVKVDYLKIVWQDPSTNVVQTWKLFPDPHKGCPPMAGTTVPTPCYGNVPKKYARDFVLPGDVPMRIVLCQDDASWFRKTFFTASPHHCKDVFERQATVREDNSVQTLYTLQDISADYTKDAARPAIEALSGGIIKIHFNGYTTIIGKRPPAPAAGPVSH